MKRSAKVSRRLAYDLGPRLASRFRQMRVMLSNRHCTVVFRGPVHIGPGFMLRIPGGGTLDVGPGVEFRRGTSIEIGGKGRITIGAGTTFTYDTMLHCSTTLDIGEQCMIGRVLIADGNHRFRDPGLPVMAQGYNFRPITIGDGACVATNAIVMAPVGERVFVGANAVVTKPIPDYSLALGAPAEVAEFYGPEGYDSSTLSRPSHMRGEA